MPFLTYTVGLALGFTLGALVFSLRARPRTEPREPQVPANRVAWRPVRHEYLCRWREN